MSHSVSRGNPSSNAARGAASSSNTFQSLHTCHSLLTILLVSAVQIVTRNRCQLLDLVTTLGIIYNTVFAIKKICGAPNQTSMESTLTFILFSKTRYYVTLEPAIYFASVSVNICRWISGLPQLFSFCLCPSSICRHSCWQRHRKNCKTYNLYTITLIPTEVWQTESSVR